MALSHSPRIVTENLVLLFDAANNNSILNTVEVLVVAGGGAGGGYGGNDGSGGGGAGGLIYSSVVSITPGTPISVTVGGGGAGVGGATRGNNGGNSVFGSLTAIGGGGGGSEGAADQRPGGSGGSGGGGGGYGVASGTGGNGTAGQGNRGGDCTGPGDGGGGGAGSAGESGLTGKGGIGLLSNISGTPTYYAGGGGASGDKRNTRGGDGALGGLGGGGKGQDATNSIAPENGTTNTGGGGGAAAGSNSTYGAGTTLTSGAGGSGIVIVRYPGSQRATGGTVTSVGGYTIHTFTTSGTFITSFFIDLSNNKSNIGILTNGPTYNSANGGSIVFDGTNDYISLIRNDFNTSLPNFTISALVYKTADGIILGNHYHGSTWESVWFSTTDFTVNAANNHTTNRQTLSYTTPSSSWMNLVAVNNSSQNYMKVFLNGAELATKTAAVIPWNSSIIPTIGAQLYTGTNAPTGPISANIAQVSIYNRALSATEISQNFNALRGRYGI